MTSWVNHLAVQTYELRAAPGPELDSLLALLIRAGCTAEPIDAAKGRYRLGGNAEVLQAASQEQPAALALEEGAAGITLTASIAPAVAPRRTTFVEGGPNDAGRVVRAAVDRRLTVRPAGGLGRWAVTGATAAQVSWLAEVQGVSEGEVLEVWRLTPEAVAAEDAPLFNVSVPVTVTLPDRKKVTEIVRNRAGDIVSTSSVETDL